MTEVYPESDSGFFANATILSLHGDRFVRFVVTSRRGLGHQKPGDPSLMPYNVLHRNPAAV